MSFGRKGMTGEIGANNAAPFGNPGLPPSDPTADDLAAQRKAFLESERSRRARRRVAVASGPLSKQPNVRSSGTQTKMWEPSAGSSRPETDAFGASVFGPPEKRHIILAYVLWAFLGVFSIHRVYCGSSITARYQFALFFCSAVLAGTTLGGALWVAWSLWFVADLYLMPIMMKRFKRESRRGQYSVRD